MADRRDWRKRKCHCSKPVKFRHQIDYAYCGDMKCYDTVIAQMGWRRLPKKRKEAARG